MLIIIVVVLVRMVNIVLDINYNFFKIKMLLFVIKYGNSIYVYNKWIFLVKGFFFYEEKIFIFRVLLLLFGYKLFFF